MRKIVDRSASVVDIREGGRWPASSIEEIAEQFQKVDSTVSFSVIRCIDAVQQHTAGGWIRGPVLLRGRRALSAAAIASRGVHYLPELAKVQPDDVAGVATVDHDVAR